MLARARTALTALCAVVATGCSLTSLEEIEGRVANARDAGPDGPLLPEAGSQDGGGWCVPKSCAELGAECGLTLDGCGKLLDCGSCSSSSVCEAGNRCTCVPKTCAALNAECGSQPDGCGGQLDCGSCGESEQCDDGQCECVPESCASRGWSCGSGSDGCGGSLDCGGCTGNTTCLGHECVLAAGNVCGSCPSGFSAKYLIENNECGSYCGLQLLCVRDGIAASAYCGTSCEPGMHAAVLTTACGCAGSDAVVCVPD